ncbi:TPA: fimbrial protein [Salmonella enterica subsp. salamae]|nr:fimbrial protein [Salmonella enterica subsp. salamae]SQH41856.1 fimbrial protein [Salmonella enterica]HAU3357521.1 fimbrial protein [Salmonella enterica subsp. salamae]
MMNIKSSTLIALAMSSAFFTAASSAITGTPSVQATFTSLIEAGTCTAQIQNNGGQQINTLPFGDVFKSDLVAQSRSEPFKIVFSGCAGVKTASVQATTGAGGTCSGNAKDGDSFNASNGAAFEVWKGISGSGTLMSCNTKPSQSVAIGGTSTSVDMAARIVIAKDKTIADVTAGDVSTPVTFVITYQ